MGYNTRIQWFIRLDALRHEYACNKTYVTSNKVLKSERIGLGELVIVLKRFSLLQWNVSSSRIPKFLIIKGNDTKRHQTLDYYNLSLGSWKQVLKIVSPRFYPALAITLNPVIVRQWQCLQKRHRVKCRMGKKEKDGCELSIQKFCAPCIHSKQSSELIPCTYGRFAVVGDKGRKAHINPLLVSVCNL